MKSEKSFILIITRRITVGFSFFANFSIIIKYTNVATGNEVQYESKFEGL